MACKMECPNCNKVLKQKDDFGKHAQGEYEVINSAIRQLKCLECDFLRTIDDWSEHNLLK